MFDFFPIHGSTLKKLVWLRKVTAARLPDGYTKIAGITMNNGPYYVITGFKLKGSDTLRFSFSATDACNILGCYTTGSAQTNYSLYVGLNTAKYMRYNGGTYDSAIVVNTKYDVVMSPTGSTGIQNPSTWTEKDFTAASDMCVGTTSTGATSAKLKGTLYGDLVVDGRLRLIPCKRTSDGEIGYYSPQTETFYENQGSGTPTEYVPS